MNSTFLHLLCIAPLGNLPSHADLWADIWQDSSLVRCRFRSAQEPILADDLGWASVILLDCSNKGAAYNCLSQLRVFADRVFLVSFTEMSGGKIATSHGSLDVVSAFTVREQWRQVFGAFLHEEPPFEIKWSPAVREHHDLKRLKLELGSSLARAVSTYFPVCNSAIRVESVTGGLSGTPLLKISVHAEGFFLKFFPSEEEFIREWDKHVLAKQWLGQYTVDLLPIAELPASGAGQSVAFRKSGPDSSQAPRYPICFRSADVTATLKNLYPFTGPTFSLVAYTQVLEAFSGKQTVSKAVDLELWELLDTAPGTNSSDCEMTILDSIRSSEFLDSIEEAISILDRYARVGNISFGEDLSNLQTLLHGTNPPWLTKRVSVAFGRSHGDANSRNFLFDGTKSHPSGLKIIDCGSFEESAPLVFDLAQMESDLKVALMATERSDNFGDIDTSRLIQWWKQDLASLENPFQFEIVTEDEPTVRAFTAIESIRERAREYSGAWADSRAYLFCLLYWTLRKLRRQDLPHAKRVLALWSAAHIAAILQHWKDR